MRKFPQETLSEISGEAIGKTPREIPAEISEEIRMKLCGSNLEKEVWKNFPKELLKRCYVDLFSSRKPMKDNQEGPLEEIPGEAPWEKPREKLWWNLARNYLINLRREFWRHFGTTFGRNYGRDSGRDNARNSEKKTENTSRRNLGRSLGRKSEKTSWTLERLRGSSKEIVWKNRVGSLKEIPEGSLETISKITPGWTIGETFGKILEKLGGSMYWINIRSKFYKNLWEKSRGKLSARVSGKIMQGIPEEILR